MTEKKSSEESDVYEKLEKSFKKRGLGRGLDALFEDEEGDYPQLDEDGQVFEVSDSNIDPSTHKGSKYRRLISVAQIYPGAYQPRKKFNDESLEELAQSLQQHGMIQPLLVRPDPHGSDRFEIVAGERRWRAAQIANIHEVPVIIKDLSDKMTLEIGLIENLQREDLNPIDEATALSQLIEEFDYTQEEAGQSIGKSRPYVANMVRLMTLPEKVQGYLREGSLSAGHARALITSENPEILAKEIIDRGLNVREVESFIQETKGQKPSSRSKAKSIEKPTKDLNTLALEKEISDKMGLHVSIDLKKKNKGSVSISFQSLDQLDEIVKCLYRRP